MHVFGSYTSTKILLCKISDLDKSKENSMKFCIQQCVNKCINIFANLVSIPLPTSPVATPAPDDPEANLRKQVIYHLSGCTLDSMLSSYRQS